MAAEAHGEKAVLPFFPQESDQAPYVCVCDFILGAASKHEFQAETKKLLDIVARSLYSEKEVGHLYLPRAGRHSVVEALSVSWVISPILTQFPSKSCAIRIPHFLECGFLKTPSECVSKRSSKYSQGASVLLRTSALHQ